MLKIEPNHALALTALDILKIRADMVRLPHVGPFEAGAELQSLDAGPELGLEPSIPPFLAALEKGQSTAPRTKPSAPQSIWHRRETWITVALCLLGLVVTVMVAVLIFQGIPK